MKKPFVITFIVQVVMVSVMISFVIPITVAAEDLTTKQIVARTELHPISSLTISDEQFLKGDDNGKPVTVTTQFRSHKARDVCLWSSWLTVRVEWVQT